EDGASLAANGRFLGDLIQVSLEFNPDRTLRHEALHALKDAGIFTDEEWNVLSNAAEKEGWRKAYNIDARYRDAPEDVKIEEAIAHAWSDWNTGRANIKSNPIKRLFSRI